jgi:uncharacterized protein YcbX
MQPVLSAINIYPIKSLGGIALREARVERRGLRYDRRWMLVNTDNKFITQREHPRMALVSIRVKPEGLEASAPGMKPLSIPFDLKTAASVTVTVWQSTCESLTVGEFADLWFSRFLGAACRLVYMPDETRRLVNTSYAVHDGDIASFADGYPFHLIGEASLEDLNTRLAAAVPMNRFRPNFVVTGSGPFEEDNWRKIRIGTTLFHVVKPCERCQITTVDQQTGERTGREPLHQLAQYRAENNKVLFGQYLIAETEDGILRVGDKIEVINRKTVETADARR